MADALHELEQAAVDLMSSIAPLRIGVSGVADDITAMQRLRGAEIAERGWASPGSISSRLDQDDYDADAVHVGIWDGPEIVGTCRLIVPAPHRPLPIERDFGLQLEPAGRVVQWSRLVLAPRYRGDPQHRLAIACFAALWLQTTQRGFAACAGMVDRSMLQLYRGLGIEFRVLGAPRFVDGEERTAAVSTVATIRTALGVMRRLLQQA